MSLNFIDNVVIQIKDIEVNRLFYGRQINISQAKISLIQLNFSRCTQCQIIRSSPHKIRRWKSVVVSSIQESRCITGCYLPGAVHGGGGAWLFEVPLRGATKLLFTLLSILSSIICSIIYFCIYYPLPYLLSISNSYLHISISLLYIIKTTRRSRRVQESRARGSGRVWWRWHGGRGSGGKGLSMHQHRGVWRVAIL